ncbi:MAG TPA: copper resistance CopC family protein [Candidatus Binatia bacterium]|nr:copper resistance CopC family protein [Candidatus Binatia bacterium]
MGVRVASLRAFFLGVILVLVASAARVSAHAVLTRSSLRDAPVKANTSTDVTLTFNSGIEAGLTQVVLRSEGPDRTLAVRPGPQPSQIAVTVPALPPGFYALQYKVLATDGHVTENVLRFRVEAPR